MISSSQSCYVGLGSNMGDRAANLAAARKRVEEADFHIIKTSSIYETEPVGYRDQPWFLNQVIEIIQTGPGGLNEPFTPEEVLESLLEIEIEMGRERTIAGGPRVIDIDLLLCGDCVVQPGSALVNACQAAHGVRSEDSGGQDIEGASSNLILPHPRLHQRRFVLEPLCEIGPNVKHPLLDKTCGELLRELQDKSRVALYNGLP